MTNTNTATIDLGFANFTSKKVAHVTWPDQSHRCCGQVWAVVDGTATPTWVDNFGTNLADVHGRSSQCGNCGSVKAWKFRSATEWVPR